MKKLLLLVLFAALAASPAYADKDILGHDIPVHKKHKEDPPPVLPGLSGETGATTAPQNAAEGDAAASKQAPPAADAAMFERQDKSTGQQPAAAEKKPEDAGKKKPEGQ